MVQKTKGIISPTNRTFTVVFVILILAAAGYLRLHNLHTSPIQNDQSILLSIAMRWVNGGMIPLAANKSSAGIMNPPLIVYLLSLPLFIQPTLMAVHVFLALLGVGAVALLLSAHRLFGWRVVLLAGLLFAVNPWAVHYSRFIWNPNPTPFFSTLLLLSLIVYIAGKPETSSATKPTTYLWVVQPIAFSLMVAVVALAAITQVHLSGLVLIPTVSLIAIVFWRRWLFSPQAWAGLVAGGLLALALYAPFLEYERAVGFTDLQATLTALTGGNSPNGDVGEPETNAAALLLAQDLATGDNISDITTITNSPVLSGLNLISSLLFFASLIYTILTPFLWRWRHPQQPLPPRQRILVIIALWLTVPILLYLRHTIYLQNYYFLYLFPAPFLAAGLFLDDVINRLSPRIPVILLILAPILALALGQFYVTFRHLMLIDSGVITQERQADYISTAIEMGEKILADNPGCDLIVLAEGGTLESASLALLEDFLYPTPVRFVDANRGYIIPADCGVYLTVNDNNVAMDWLVDQGRLRSEMVVAGPETWRFYEVSGEESGAEGSKADWQNGLSLLSAEWGSSVPGTPLTVRYEWLVGASPEKAHYHFFNHFVDGEGNIVAQEDAPAIESLYWRPGDWLITFFSLSLPVELARGDYELYVGQYTWPDLIRVELVNQTDSRYHVGTVTVR